MTWLSGWTRRKIKIVENLTISDYQMKLIIHKSGLGPDTSTDIYLGDHCRDDFADLRFTDPGQTTLLSYWIESITGTTPNLVATVWIKIPTLTPTNNIYIYYDNPIASLVSSGTNTFLFFDHFEGSAVDGKWVWGAISTIYGSGSIVVSNSIVELTGGVSTWWGLRASNATKTSIPFVIEYYTKISESTSNHQNVLGASSFTGDGWGYDMAYIGSTGTPGNIYGSRNNGTGSEESRATTLIPWTKVNIVVKSGSVDFYENNVLTYTKTTNVPDEPMGAWMGVAQVIGKIWVDYVFIRKYASPEPTFGVSGSEELNITATLMTLNTNTCAGPCQIIAGVTWQNLGSSSVTFTPAILIDGTILAYGTNITISAGGTNSATITTPTLSIGSHTICPYPN